MKIYFLFLTAILVVSGQILYPTPGTIWKVGEIVSVVFLGEVQVNETVSLYFNNDRTTSLGGGPLSKDGTIFQFSVPSSAKGLTDLVAVHRVNFYLYSVDSIPVQIV
ncbi:hypothetical protein G6F56_007053 [Rhizopus delemar]|nr:hypothetical protein G6F56_007053 [Rhizopus delemar]